MSQPAPQAVTPDGHGPTGGAEAQGASPGTRPWEPEPDPPAENQDAARVSPQEEMPPAELSLRRAALLTPPGVRSFVMVIDVRLCRLPDVTDVAEEREIT